MPELDNTSQVIDIAPPPVGNIPDAAPTVAKDEPVNWETAADAEMSKIFRTNNPERSDDGKFASREPQTDTPKLPDQAQTEKVEQPVAAINAPQSWSAEMKAVFPSLPPAVQDFVAKRESEAQAKITQQGQELSSFEPIKSVIEQHKDIFERNGLDFSDGLGRLLHAERLLEQNPHAAIAQIAQAYGVDLGQYNGQQQPQNSAEQALHQRIAHLESQLNDTTGRIQQREAKEAETQAQSTQTLIEKFSTDKPDWADLETDIHTEIIGIKAAIAEKLIPALQPAEILAKAYERAQRNNPDAWAKKLAADEAAKEKDRVEKAKKNADDLKRAKSVNVTGSPLNGRTVNSMDDDLRETYRKLNA